MFHQGSEGDDEMGFLRLSVHTQAQTASTTNATRNDMVEFGRLNRSPSATSPRRPHSFQMHNEETQQRLLSPTKRSAKLQSHTLFSPEETHEEEDENSAVAEVRARWKCIWWYEIFDTNLPCSPCRVRTLGERFVEPISQSVGRSAQRRARRCDREVAGHWRKRRRKY